MAKNESTDTAPYKESDDHVPDPTLLRGIFRTDGLGGHQVIEDIAPVFEQARHEAAVQAGRAIDPSDPGVPPSAVVFPEETFDREEAIRAIKEKAGQDAPDPLGPGPSQRAAAREDTDVPDAGAESAQATEAAARADDAGPSVGARATAADAGSADQAAADQAAADKAAADKVAADKVAADKAAADRAAADKAAADKAAADKVAADKAAADRAAADKAAADKAKAKAAGSKSGNPSGSSSSS